MGPTLARMARRAQLAAGGGGSVTAVSRVAGAGGRTSRAALEAAGVRTQACDLLDSTAVASLPEAPAVLFLAGTKFGAAADPARTWAINAYMPGLVGERYRGARMVVFSSGNVYPLVPVDSGGATESTAPAPRGEYAQSVLGRERVLEHFARTNGTKMLIYRLNYAVELRYGVLVDLAHKVWAGEPIDVTMGHVNAIWQGDANAVALRCLELCTSPPAVLNVTGPQTLSVRALAERLGALLGRPPLLVGEEARDALLSNARRAHELFGAPTVDVDQMLERVAHWVRRGGRSLGKATKFEVRNGSY
jgi:nucleoside-diphosphate-sugar epimerase